MRAKTENGADIPQSLNEQRIVQLMEAAFENRIKETLEKLNKDNIQSPLKDQIPEAELFTPQFPRQITKISQPSRSSTIIKSSSDTDQ